jgi:DNA-binding MarR family transcriptional regulator
VRSREQAIDSVQRTLSSLMRVSASRSTFARQSAASGVALTQPAYVLLRVMLDTGPIPMGELARLAYMDEGMAARQVASLVDEELATRRPDPADGRVTLVLPTPRGERAATALRDVRTRHLERALAGWSVADLDALGELLLRFQTDAASTPFEEA